MECLVALGFIVVVLGTLYLLGAFGGSAREVVAYESVTGRVRSVKQVGSVTPVLVVTFAEEPEKGWVLEMLNRDVVSAAQAVWRAHYAKKRVRIHYWRYRDGVKGYPNPYPGVLFLNGVESVEED